MNKTNILSLFGENLYETKRLKNEMGISPDPSDEITVAIYRQQNYNYGNKIREMKKFVRYHD